ncbi:PilW family protein [Idiomarina aquatica]|uniref:MSHA biogenesis protein MshO n=1 Tax=Idiomarina aquatica TaxID=1327752 RepID=A0AA94EI14_9GAMM|nr:type II secretion system protein [Idiomarina aquatica]RUO45395.1 hypothetical protein CWE23_05155 [Idiomarina aquatica]
MLRLTCKGFTLVELVIAIILLAIVGTFSFRFIGLGADVFRDASARSQLVSQSRFALERLSRELRNALPLSVRVYDGQHCIEYTPILTSGEYIDAPTSANPGNTVTAMAPLQRKTQPVPARYLVIYNTKLNAIYGTSGQRYRIDARQRDAGSHTIDFTLSDSESDPIEFNLIGPSRRYYEVSPPVSWCYLPDNGQIRRYQSTDFNVAPPAPSVVANGELMAEQLRNDNSEPVFEVDNITLSQNNLVLIDFVFERDDAPEPLRLLYEVHVPNVP